MAKQVLPAGEKPKSPPEKAHGDSADTLKSKIDREIGPLVQQQQRAEIVRRITDILVQNEHFSGPIAHPKHLRTYEEIVPGAAERIISMAEKAQAHNIEMESLTVQSEIADQKRGMYLGFTALIVLVLLAFAAGIMGHEILATAFLAASVIGVVVTFIKGRNGG